MFYFKFRNHVCRHINIKLSMISVFEMACMRGINIGFYNTMNFGGAYSLFLSRYMLQKSSALKTQKKTPKRSTVHVARIVNNSHTRNQKK